MLNVNHEISNVSGVKKKPVSNNVVPLMNYRSMVEEAAYYLAEQRGFEPGHELKDWLQAEHLVGIKLRCY